MRNKYYVKAYVEDDKGNVRRAEDDEIPDLWSAYEVQEDGTSLCIADFWDVDRAQEYVKWLLER